MSGEKTLSQNRFK